MPERNRMKVRKTVNQKPNNKKLINHRKKELDKNSTPAENRMKNLLKKKQFKFEKNKVFMNGDYFYFADFYLPELDLVIEIDGKYHETEKQMKVDYYKDRYYTETKKLKLLRITNKKLAQIGEKVVDTILSLMVLPAGTYIRLDHYEQKTKTKTVLNSVEKVEVTGAETNY
jgi:very-short-patch-repair endonuclease